MDRLPLSVRAALGAQRLAASGVAAEVALVLLELTV
jgi:hypothetical protein